MNTKKTVEQLRAGATYWEAAEYMATLPGGEKQWEMVWGEKEIGWDFSGCETKAFAAGGEVARVWRETGGGAAGYKAVSEIRCRANTPLGCAVQKVCCAALVIKEVEFRQKKATTPDDGYTSWDDGQVGWSNLFPD